ncbi:conjugal transfer protein TraB [Streptomyces sp. KN37]|uniref:conjugal transfer protein TraB n=1 Tax=Streptomyces sp. KN37 TaxID=3090667 RepID=UPI002A75E9B2|nr:conjugal transfer protein TraB [Streptomyces sp. KN37]WPO76273.1 conjugal transfer protein TraB [Streptomyces sp. KN37]
MSSALTPRSHTVPVVADNDNRYKAVQAKLDKLGKAMDDATIELESLRRSMETNAKQTDCLATDIENAGLDPKFVALTHNVATALDGAAREVRGLCDTAHETTDLTHRTRRTHSKLYRALDEIRSNRREKTPKPGFFTR